MSSQDPIFVNAASVERCAEQIDDPVARLRYLQAKSRAPVPTRPRRFRWLPYLLLTAAVLPLASDATVRTTYPEPPVPQVRTWRASTAPPNVWAVELASQHEMYSNGLRIESGLTVANEPRSYSLIGRTADLRIGPVRYQPSGIVYHASESDQAPFQADHNHRLKRIGQNLLLYVRSKHAYNYVIDRFGRVYRIVAESDAAFHAGRSVWADDKWVYVDLNAAFLGIAFEARSQEERETLSPAQVHAARLLTEMLRSKYNIPAENCVTHAQVSVNPDNWNIGYHTDWGRRLPFQEMGLPPNYLIPNPSLYLFGFTYSGAYTAATGPEIWNGLAVAEERVRTTAKSRGISAVHYRMLLQQRYRTVLSALRNRSALEEN